MCIVSSQPVPLFVSLAPETMSHGIIVGVIVPLLQYKTLDSGSGYGNDDAVQMSQTVLPAVPVNYTFYRNIVYCCNFISRCLSYI